MMTKEKRNRFLKRIWLCFIVLIGVSILIFLCPIPTSTLASVMLVAAFVIPAVVVAIMIIGHFVNGPWWLGWLIMGLLTMLFAFLPILLARAYDKTTGIVIIGGLYLVVLGWGSLLALLDR
jgi:hypothetical protein